VFQGPAQYLADTPDGAWAEFLRHEEITDPADLAGVARRLWAVELPVGVDDAAEPQLSREELVGGLDSYPACQAEASRLRDKGVTVMRAPSAALRRGGAGGQVTDRGLIEAPARDGVVWVLFGTYPSLRAWAVVDAGAPPVRTLRLVRHLGAAVGGHE
jgi:hypothetical protein